MDALSKLLVGVIGVVVFSLFMGFHGIPEGHIGVYWFGGALLDRTTEPGFHFMTPFLTTFSAVQVTLQTDVVTNIPCGTAGGSMIYFETIEVVNRLRKENAHKTVKLYGVNYDRVWIFDKIAHEINQFCSLHTLQQVYIDMFDQLDEALARELQKSCDKYETGIEIISIRVTKPTIPESVRKNYEEVEKEKTRYLVQVEHEKVIKKEEEISRLRARMQAEKESEIAQIEAQKLSSISKITLETELAQKEMEKKKRVIDDEIKLNHEKAVTDSLFYRITKEAEANQQLYSEQYLRYVLYTSLANNTKIFFGESIPKIFLPFLNGDDSTAPAPFTKP